MIKRSASPMHSGVLMVGFLAFTLAVLAAHVTPATGYEVSIYASTPTPFWIGIGIGSVVGVVMLFATASDRLRQGSLLLLTLCLLSVVSIPLLRSYFYYGGGDSMTHLGWAREMQAGVIGADGVLYPAIHLIAIFFAEAAGLDLTQTLQYVPLVVFPLVYLIAMPLCVSYFSDSPWAVPVGLFSALLFVPINKISLNLMAHPSSQAILFFPFVLFLLFRYLTDDSTGFPLRSPIGAAFLLSGIGLLFVHPQETMTLVSILIAIAVTQRLYERYDPSGAIASHRSVGFHTVALTAVFLAWIVQHERARDRAAYVVESLIVAGGQTLEETSARGDSLATLGGSFEELFIKLFVVSVVFCVLAAGVMLANLFDRLDPAQSRRNAVITYLTVGLVPPTLVFLVIFFADQGDHYFRFLGMIMAIVTLVGAISLTAIVDTAMSRVAERSRSISRRHVIGVLAVVFVGLLVLQMVAIHESPYIYQPNKQVSEADMSGHEIAFEHHDGETVLMGLRRGSRRFIDAHYGHHTARSGLDFPGYRTGLSEDVFNTNLTTHFDDDRYLVIKDSDYDREVVLYEELRYSEDGFHRLDRSPRVNRVQDNGAFRLYRIDGS